MRIFISLLFGLLSCVASAQLSMGISYYQDTTKFDRPRDQYDATDAFGGWDDFVRFEMGYRFRSNHSLCAYMEVDAGWTPRNFLISHRYYPSHFIHIQSILKKQVIFTPNYDELSYEYDQYHNVYQAGLGVGLEKEISIFIFGVQTQYLLGLSEKTIHRRLELTDSNLRILHEEIFKTNDFRSLNTQVSAAFRLFKIKEAEVAFKYEFVWRRDWFDFVNRSRQYEWTWDGIVEDDSYTYSHIFDHFQHHFGFVIDLNSHKD